MTSFFYICWIVLLLQIDLGYAVVNLALGKAALFCEVLVESEKLTDGDRNPTNSVYLDSACPPYTDLEIYLGKPYNIHYVVIYPGMTVSYTEGLHFCVIDLYGPGILGRCSEYPFKNIQPGVPMRINCKDLNRLFPKVLVKPHYDERGLAIFDIAEIGVYTLALQYETYPLFHRGCYAYMEGVPEAMTWENCQKKCFDGDYIFAAIKANSHCVCSNNLQESASRDDLECGIPCEGNRFCGGMNAFSVYIIKPPLPYYIGCYYHYWDGSGILDAYLITITCLRYCKDWPFFAMMFGDRCKCLNEEPSHKERAGSHCYKSCFGDERQGCGSEIGMTAYKTCLRSNTLTCNNIFRCKNEYDMYGVCISGCQTGFSGEYCLHKDFKLNITITTTTTMATTITTEIATLRATLTNQSGDEDQRKTLLRQLRNILPFVMGGIITLCCLLVVCSASSEERSSTPSSD